MDDVRWPVVLFDLDGTLANTIPLILASYEEATKSILGMAVDDVEARSWIGRPLREVFVERYPEQVEELMERYLTWNDANLDRLIQTYPGADALVRDLVAAGVEVGIVTSKRRTSADRTLRAVGLHALFTTVVTMDDTPEHKPEPGPLLHAAGKLGRAASECVYVGDAIWDLRAAHAAGMDAIGVTWGAGSREHLLAEEPLAVVSQWDDLRALLLGRTSQTEDV